MSPFTQADSIKAQRLQQALSQAQQSLDDGEIEPRDHQALVGQIMQQLAPLMERQQQQKQQMQQEAEAEMTRQHAHLQAMEQQAAVFRAQGLLERIVTIVDPMDPTRVAKLYEASPGKWEEIKFEGAKEEPEMPQPAGGEE